MNALTPSLAVLWVTLGVMIILAVDGQGRIVGGKQYFMQLGMAGAVIAEYALAVLAFSISIFLTVSLFIERPMKRRMCMLATIFTLLAFVIYLPLIVPSLNQHAILNLFVFPAAFAWLPHGAVVIGAITAIAVLMQEDPQQTLTVYVKHG